MNYTKWRQGIQFQKNRVNQQTPLNGDFSKQKLTDDELYKANEKMFETTQKVPGGSPAS